MNEIWSSRRGPGFTVWAELALTVEHVAEATAAAQRAVCWLLAVTWTGGAAGEPATSGVATFSSRRWLPVKLASGALLPARLPALLRLWPFVPPGDRRVRGRLDAGRALCWFPYCGLFTTLFFPPSGDESIWSAAFFASRRSSRSRGWSGRCVDAEAARVVARGLTCG